MEPVYVKRYAPANRWKQAKEVHVYALLAERGVPVPSVVDADAAAGATTLTVVPGTALSEAPVEPDAVRDVYRQIGALLAAVHEIAQPEFGYLTTELVDPQPHNTAYMTRQFTLKLAEFAALGGDQELHRLIGARVADRSGLFGLCAGPVLCHNDLHEGNVLVEPAGTGWRLTGLIDVENAIAADPLMDLAKTVQYDQSRSPAKFAGLLEGYGPLPPDGLARIALYRLYHALELWDWFALIGATAPLDGIAEDIRLLATS
jgi:aminoglycoside phosphotransferase (APT) family kinase protein